jgi:hypothetical protein
VRDVAHDAREVSALVGREGRIVRMAVEAELSERRRLLAHEAAERAIDSDDAIRRFGAGDERAAEVRLAAGSR